MRVDLGDDDARFHRYRRDARYDRVETRHIRGRLDRPLDRLGIAALPEKSHVVGRFRPERRRTRCDGILPGGARGLLLEVDDDCLGGFESAGMGFGHHNRQRLADEPHSSAGEQRAVRFWRLAAVGAGEIDAARKIGHPVGGKLLRRQDRDHAGKCPRRAGIDASECGTRVG